MSYLADRGPRPGPFFIFQAGRPLTQARFVTEVMMALDSSGVDSTCYSAHSFRSGAATMAMRRGLGDAAIRRHGGGVMHTGRT